MIKKKIYEGKAKVIYKGKDTNTLIQYFKDDATAFNNKKKGVIPGKGVVNNFISETKDLLNSVIKNTLGVSHSLLDILGFTFLLVPTMDTLSKLISDYSLSIGNVNTLFTGLLLSVATYSVKAVINKIKGRFN